MLAKARSWSLHASRKCGVAKCLPNILVLLSMAWLILGGARPEVEVVVYCDTGYLYETQEEM